MSSVRKLSSQKPSTGTRLPSSRRGESEWKIIERTFKEEVGRLKEENVNLQNSRALLTESWQGILKKIEVLADENSSSNKVLHTLLNQEREKLEDCVKENESLSNRLKKLKETCAVQQREIQRLSEVSEREKKTEEVYIRLCDEHFQVKSAEFQVELLLRDKHIEDARRELSECAQKHAISIELDKKAFEAERLQWVKLREGYEAEIFELRAQVSKLECFSQQSPCSAIEEVIAVPEKPPLVPSYDSVCDDVNRKVSKKSRLEAARMQRRQKEQVNDTKTLISLNKLRDLKENFCV